MPKKPSRVSKSANAHPYDTDELIAECIKFLKTSKYAAYIWSFRELALNMGYDPKTFKRHGLYENAEIQTLLDRSKVTERVKKRMDLSKNDHASAQIAYYKLVAPEEDILRLKMERDEGEQVQKTDNTLKIEIVKGED